MLAMQYSIRLANDFDEARLRKRVADRGHLFDNMAGLAHKGFLFNAEQRVYAPFYVWSDHAKARDFLLGPIFANVVQSFGRPRVRIWGVFEFDTVMNAPEPRVAVRCVEPLAPDANLMDIERTECERHEAELRRRGLWAHTVALDCDRWELVRYSLWTDRECAAQVSGDCINIYEVLRVSPPCVEVGARKAWA
jgi:hypothetical protein